MLWSVGRVVVVVLVMSGLILGLWPRERRLEGGGLV